jgi:Flp pilus assembly pilin Flp
MRRFLTGLLAALIASVAVAQASTVSDAMTISWTAPPTDAQNGNALAGSTNAITGYNIYVSTTTLTAVPTAPTATVGVSNGTVAATVSATLTETVGTNLFVYVTACNSSGCGALSVPGTYLVEPPAAVPGVPTNVTITVVIK